MTAIVTEATIQSFIEKFSCTYRPESLRERYDGEFLVRGMGSLDQVTREIPNGFSRVGEWSNAYRVVWKSDELRTIISYCEGDVTVSQQATDDMYHHAIAVANDFYLKYS